MNINNINNYYNQLTICSKKIAKDYLKPIATVGVSVGTLYTFSKIPHDNPFLKIFSGSLNIAFGLLGILDTTVKLDRGSQHKNKNFVRLTMYSLTTVIGIIELATSYYDFAYFKNNSVGHTITYFNQTQHNTTSSDRLKPEYYQRMR